MFTTVVDQLRGLDDAALTDRLRALELEQRRLEAELAATVAEADRRDLHQVEAHRTLRTWLRAHTNCSGAQATRRLRLARLAADVPAVGEALVAGHVGIAQADELARVRANPRCGHLLGSAIDVLLEHCEHLDFDDARTCIRRWETLADADGAHRDRDVSVEARTAHVGPLGDGVTITATGGSAIDAAEFEAVFGTYCDAEYRADCAARDATQGPNAPDGALPRTAAQRGYDALRAIFRRAGAHVDDLSPAPVPPVVNLIGDLHTFETALTDHGLITRSDPDSDPDAGEPLEPAEHADPADPAETARPVDPVELLVRRCETDTGTPVLPDDLIRAALAGHVRRVVVDTAGLVVDWGRKRRLFTGAARQAAALLVRHCQRPGCSVPTSKAEIDHRRDWSHHGLTDQDNAGVLCRHDNRAKHRLALRVARTPDGYLNWRDHTGRPIAPAGRRHLPDDHDIDTAIRRRIDALAADRRQRDRRQREREQRERDGPD